MIRKLKQVGFGFLYFVCILSCHHARLPSDLGYKMTLRPHTGDKYYYSISTEVQSGFRFNNQKVESGKVTNIGIVMKC